MNYKSININNRVYNLVDFPLVCPECHNRTTPNFIHYRIAQNTNKLFAFLFCPNPICDKSYTALYEHVSHNNYSFVKIIQGQPQRESFPIEIETLSPSFITIFNEAYTAEQIGLLEISGVGFRKALEFLIKDYLINKEPEKTEQIKSMFLGKCINDLVIDSKIKETAKRAVWLGNDQTHYIKKWEDKDLLDLKKLIRLTVIWVESEILTSDLQNSMPE
jgi:Domain of unknown function (DUF4145)